MVRAVPGRVAGPNDRRTDILTGHGLADAGGVRAQMTRIGVSREQSEGEALLSLILSALEEDSAEDILPIPLAGKSQEADHMVIASGRSSRHVGALAEKLAERLKQAGAGPRIEGKETADWVLIDAGDVVVHVFRPEVRDFYELEKMWLTPAERTARSG